MNTRDSSTPPAPAARFNGRSVSIDVEKLGLMSHQECRHLCAAIETLTDVCAGLTCQPKFFDGQYNYNRAGDELEELCEWLGQLKEAVYELAKQRTPTSPREAEERAWCILGTMAGWGDGLDDFAVAAAEAVRDHNQAIWNEKHPNAPGTRTAA